MQNPSVKATVVDFLQDARAAQMAFVESLSEAERGATGTADKWAAKDIVAHTIFWQVRHEVAL